MAKNDEWLTIRESAILAGYHPETIRELARDGKIAARKVSIVWLINRKSLDAYLSRVEKLGEKRGRKSEAQ